MAEPTLVNGQITDAVTQASVEILGSAPALAMGTIYQAMGQSIGLSMQNAVTMQQQMNQIGQTATTQGINLLMTSPPAAASRAADHIMTGNAVAQQLLAVTTALAASREAGQTVSDPSNTGETDGSPPSG